MYYLFKMPAVNSASKNFELLAESHDHTLIEALYKAYQSLNHYDCLFVATVPTPEQKDKKGAKGAHLTHTRPDDPPKKKY